MSISGTLKKVKIAGREFACEAENEPVYNPGVETSGEAHSFGVRKKILKRPASLTGLELNIESSIGDDQFLIDMQESTQNYDLLWTKADNNSAGGLGFIANLTFNEGKNTATLDFIFNNERTVL